MKLYLSESRVSELIPARRLLVRISEKDRIQMVPYVSADVETLQLTRTLGIYHSMQNTSSIVVNGRSTTFYRICR